MINYAYVGNKYKSNRNENSELATQGWYEVVIFAMKERKERDAALNIERTEQIEEISVRSIMQVVYISKEKANGYKFAFACILL